MNDAKYIGLDVHQATISVAVRDRGHSLNESRDDSAVSPWLARQFARHL